MTFQQQFNYGKIAAKDAKVAMKKNQISIQCIPLYPILLAMNTTTIDYFSLDVEGFELEVLKTIPWDKVNIKVRGILSPMIREKY